MTGFDWRPGTGERTVLTDGVAEDGAPVEVIYYQLLDVLELVRDGATVAQREADGQHLELVLARMGVRSTGDVDPFPPFDPRPVPPLEPRPLAVVPDEPAASAPTPAPRFAPTDHPRIVDGIVVPARSVEIDRLATWILVPIGEVTSIGLTGRAVGVSPRSGRWQPVWIGDDLAERDRVLDQFATDLGSARRRR